MKNIINIVGGAVMAGASYLFGGWDTAMLTLCIVMSLDWVSGICKAIKQKKLNSRTGILGFLKKVGYLIIVALAVVVDHLTGETGVARTMTIYFFIANDGLSILENWGAIGLPLPQKLFDLLEQLKQDGDQAEDETADDDQEGE